MAYGTRQWSVDELIWWVCAVRPRWTFSMMLAAVASMTKGWRSSIQWPAQGHGDREGPEP
jgi:hypothetical protein